MAKGKTAPKKKAAQRTRILPLPLGSVCLRDGYSVNALEKEISYLLSLQEGRLLAGFYRNAELPTPFVRYGGWEDSLIGGHTLGHYMTALAQACANAGVKESDRAALRKKLVALVDGLAECQAHSLGKPGFLWGATPARAEGAEAQFDNVEAGKTNIVREAWVPWYTMHKILSGLIEAYRFTEYPRAKEVACALGDWVCERTARWDKRTQKRVLAVEYGGMNDCLYELYALTGEDRYAVAAHRFDEEALFDAILTEGKDVLKDKHANTTIPKVLGALNRYLTLHGKERDGERTDESRYLRVAEIFFRTVVVRHTYVTGGNSEWEHFGADYVLDKERTNCNCETCNAYNMLKLARLLFSVTGDKKYADFYENTYINSILSSQNPETGMTTYFQPMASGFFKVYGEPFDKFWCCTGSGMESFTKLGDSMYYSDGETLFVELYFSSRLQYGGIVLDAECDFPLRDDAAFTVAKAERPFRVAFRIPDWAKRGATLRVNGEQTGEERGGHLFATLSEGDRAELVFPCSVTLSCLPDNHEACAFRYGAAVLSADLGTENMTTATTGVIVTIPEKKVAPTERIYFNDLSAVRRDPDSCFVREGDTFRLTGGDIEPVFGLHYLRYRERYAIYWYLCEGDRQSEESEEREPIDVVQPGYGQYENDALHAMEESSTVGVTDDGTYRYAKRGGYFRYDMAVDPKRKNILSVELRRKDNGKTLKITAGDEVVLSEYLLYTLGEESYRREFELSDELIRRCARKKTANGKEYTVVSVRFEGLPGKQSGRVCEFIRMFAENK